MLGVSWEDDPRLVRGLDYYTRTTFEFVHDGLGSQSAIGGGGRYDGLSEDIGGPPLPGVGWALGVDRTMLALDAEGVTPPDDAASGRLRRSDRRRGAAAAVRDWSWRCVAAGSLLTWRTAAEDSRVRCEAADRSGAAYALVVGERDLQAGIAQLKDLSTGDQTAVALTELVDHLQERFP